MSQPFLLNLIEMETRDDFFVTLCSNVRNTNVENTIANFVTQLPASLYLDSTWRVGLSEIHYTNSWCNLRADSRIKIKSVFADPGDEDSDMKFNSYAAVPAGRYDDIEVLIDEIQHRMRESSKSHVQKHPKFDVNPHTRRVTMEYGYTSSGQPLEVVFDQELAEMMGVDRGYRSSYAHQIVTLTDETIDINPSVSENETFEATRSYDLTGGIHSLFVYSDVVDYSIVGDTRAQLLRMAHIPANSLFGNSVVDRYENPHYLPLSTKEISSIEVHLKDDANAQIGFEFGRVKLVLHFKRNG